MNITRNTSNEHWLVIILLGTGDLFDKKKVKTLVLLSLYIYMYIDSQIAEEFLF